MAGEWHGTGGPRGVSTPTPQRLTKVFVRACHQAGIPFTADVNGPSRAGAGFYQTTTRGAARPPSPTSSRRLPGQAALIIAATSAIGRKMLPIGAAPGRRLAHRV